MTGKEALENISIEFDEYGFVPTTTTPRKEEHFTEWWKKEYEIINKELENKEKLEKNYDKLKVEIYDVKEENKHLKAQLEFSELVECDTKKELTKYKRVFEILKDKFSLVLMPLLIVDDEVKSKCLHYIANSRRPIMPLDDEEAELLEELMKGE